MPGGGRTGRVGAFRRRVASRGRPLLDARSVEGSGGLAGRALSRGGELAPAHGGGDTGASSSTAGSIFAFIISFGQFDVSLFLGTPNLTPLPIAMYISLRYKFEATAAAAGIFAIALVCVSMIVTSRLISLKKFSGVKFS